jgi:hypothetical protein
MVTSQLSRVVQQVRSALLQQRAEGTVDPRLLERFIGVRDETAFEALIQRHGPMVMGVCRRVLHHEQDAEDASAYPLMMPRPSARRLARRRDRLKSP